MREALYPSGAKDDPRDADLFLDLLLKHRDKLRRLSPDTEATLRVQNLVEERRKLVDEKTEQINRLTSHLKIYFPQMLDWFDRLDREAACALLERWPTLHELQRTSCRTSRRPGRKTTCPSGFTTPIQTCTTPDSAIPASPRAKTGMVNRSALSGRAILPTCSSSCGELLTRYGPVALIWFDGQEKYDGARVLRMIAEIQPATLVNDRLGVDADYETPEHFLLTAIPTKGVRLTGVDLAVSKLLKTAGCAPRRDPRPSVSIYLIASLSARRCFRNRCARLIATASGQWHTPQVPQNRSQARN